MITFTVNNILTHVDNSFPIAEAVNKYLNIKSDSFYKGIDYKIYRETGRTVLKTKYRSDTLNVYNQQKQTFPTGRLGYLVDWCYDHNIPCKLVDNRIKPKKSYTCNYIGWPSDGSDGNPPRIYQQRAPELIEQKTRGVLWYATGSGKTAAAARIIQKFCVTTLYMVPSVELLNQTHDALSNMLDIEIGKIGDGTWNPKEITVATSATLWSRFETDTCKEFLNSIKMLIVDEVHHVSIGSKNKSGNLYKVNSWYIISINCPAYYRIGLTGTPGKNIEQKRGLLECTIGRIIDRVSVRELIDLGILTDVEIHLHTIKHSRTIQSYPTARKEGVLLNEELNNYICHIAISELKAGKSVLLLTGSKAHQGPSLQRHFKELGYNVPFVSGNDTRKNRVQIRKDFKAGKIQCLIGTVYKEGVDFPALDTGILCDGGRDEKGTCQFMGRILRTTKGKKIARLHDFMHKDSKHLEKHSKARLQTYFEEEIENIITHEGLDA
jgi:superfamily II DNA or RNA helicase